MSLARGLMCKEGRCIKRCLTATWGCAPTSQSVYAFRVRLSPSCWVLSFFLNDTATTEIYTLSLHVALPFFFTLVSSAVNKILYSSLIGYTELCKRYSVGISSMSTTTYSSVSDTLHDSTLWTRLLSFDDISKNSWRFWKNLVNEEILHNWNCASSLIDFHNKVFLLVKEVFDKIGGCLFVSTQQGDVNSWLLLCWTEIHISECILLSKWVSRPT